MNSDWNWMLLAHCVLVTATTGCWQAAEPIRSDPFADLGLELRAAQEATITKKHTPAQRSDGNENARTTTTTTTRANSRAPATRRMNGRYETSTSRVPSTSNRPTDRHTKQSAAERASEKVSPPWRKSCLQCAHARALTSTMRCAADSKSHTLACESSLALGTVMFTATKS